MSCVNYVRIYFSIPPFSPPPPPDIWLEGFPPSRHMSPSKKVIISLEEFALQFAAIRRKLKIFKIFRFA